MPTLITFLIGIAFLSLCPQSVPVGEIPDWLGHALAYGSLTAFARMNWPARSVAVAIAIFALGLAIELAQGFTPDRSVSVDDLIANTVGIAVVSFWRAVTPVVFIFGTLAVAGCGAMPTPENIQNVGDGDGYQHAYRDIRHNSENAPRFSDREQEALSRCRPHDEYSQYPILPRQNQQGALGTGDLIRVKVGDDELLSGTFEIEADGALHLPHLAPVQAQGHSPDALAQAVRSALIDQGLYRAPLPAVSVNALERSAVRVHVDGAVFEPGTVDVAARTAEDRDPFRQDAAGDAAHRFGLTAALRASAGLRPDAELQNILVKRAGKVWRVNLVGAMSNKTFHDPMLQPGDEVHVPSLGCFQPGLARPTVATRKGIKVHLSNLTTPAFSNAQSAIDDDVREVRYGTRLLQVLVRMNCVGGTHATNASRVAVLISKNPMTRETEVIERAIEDLVRRADRDSHDPVLMPGDAIACYDSKVTNARDVARSFIEILSPLPFAGGL